VTTPAVARVLAAVVVLAVVLAAVLAAVVLAAVVVLAVVLAAVVLAASLGSAPERVESCLPLHRTRSKAARLKRAWPRR
jgi:hypothetical protein